MEGKAGELAEGLGRSRPRMQSKELKFVELKSINSSQSLEDSKKYKRLHYTTKKS
jgi:hypothetical protein